MYMETKKEQKNEPKEKRPLTGEQRQLRRKMLVYPLMGLTFLGCMWLIFSPSQEDREKERQGQGFNTDMPQPENAGIIGDKAKAYEQQQLEKRQKQRRGMVGDLSSFWDDTDVKPDTTAAPDDCRLTPAETPRKETESRQHTGIRSSAVANKRLNTSLGTFYEPPKEDDEKKKLRRRIDELERMVMEQEKKPSAMEEQVALLEKSYELAAKYQNGGNNAGQAVQPEETETPAGHRGKKRMKAEAVSGVRPTTVSALPQPLTAPTFIADYGDERNYGFHTAIGTAEVPGKNTITACVQGDQTITDGQTVKLRLLEPMRVSGRTVPRTPPLWVRHACRASVWKSASPRWNIRGTSSRWSWRCMTTTDRRASSSPARWRLTRRRKSGRTWAARWEAASTSRPMRGRSSPPTWERA